MSKIIELNNKTEISSGFVLIDFWAPWCGNCRMMMPVVEEIQTHFGDKLQIIKANIDENEGYAKKMQIITLPTLVLLKDGKEVMRTTGFKLKTALIKLISEHVN